MKENIKKYSILLLLILIESYMIYYRYKLDYDNSIVFGLIYLIVGVASIVYQNKKLAYSVVALSALIFIPAIGLDYNRLLNKDIEISENRLLPPIAPKEPKYANCDILKHDWAKFECNKNNYKLEREYNKTLKIYNLKFQEYNQKKNSIKSETKLLGASSFFVILLNFIVGLFVPISICIIELVTIKEPAKEIKPFEKLPITKNELAIKIQNMKLLGYKVEEIINELKISKHKYYEIMTPAEKFRKKSESEEKIRSVK